MIDPHNYLLMTLDGKLLGGLFEHERLKPAVLRTSEVKVANLYQHKTGNKRRIVKLLIIGNHLEFVYLT